MATLWLCLMATSSARDVQTRRLETIRVFSRKLVLSARRLLQSRSNNFQPTPTESERTGIRRQQETLSYPQGVYSRADPTTFNPHLQREKEQGQEDSFCLPHPHSPRPFTSWCFGTGGWREGCSQVRNPCWQEEKNRRLTQAKQLEEIQQQTQV